MAEDCKSISSRYACSWLDGLQKAPETAKENIAKAVAEWADADSVAAHIAYGNNISVQKTKLKRLAKTQYLAQIMLHGSEENMAFLCKTPEEIMAMRL